MPYSWGWQKCVPGGGKNQDHISATPIGDEKIKSMFFCLPYTIQFTLL